MAKVSILLLAIFTAMTLLFQSCASFKVLDMDTTAGQSYCTDNVTDSVCSSSLSLPSCQFNGVKLSEQQSVMAYRASTVNSGESCLSEKRTCKEGSLTGSFQFSACTVEGPASCLFNGRTIQSGGSVTAYINSSGNCDSENRICTNGVLSGSMSYATCQYSAKASCLFDGKTIPHGSSLVAFAASTVAYNQDCVPQIRTCLNGTLSGSGTFASCVKNQAAACSFGGQTFPHGSTVNAYPISNVAYGQTCPIEVRSCSNGQLSGSAPFTSCAVNQPASCLLNGRTLAHGESTTLYVNPSAPAFHGSCTTEVRTCNNGVVSGSAVHDSCTLTTNVLDRAMPPGSRNLYVALRSSANGKFVVAQPGTKALMATADHLSATSIYALVRITNTRFALANIGSGGYMTAENAGASGLVADRPSLGEWEQFEAHDLGGYNMAFSSITNGLFVSAAEAGSSPLIANRPNFSTWEVFQLLPVIDMAAVLTSFADRHASEKKLRSFEKVTGSGGYFSNASIWDRRVPARNEIIVTMQSHDGVLIHDWYWLDDEQVGIRGTFPIIPGFNFTIWDKMIRMGYRYMTPDMVGTRLNGGSYDSYDGKVESPEIKYSGTGLQDNFVSRLGMMNTEGAMGSRWVIGIKSYPSKNGILEEWIYDLGHAEGVFSPEYGAIGYEQTNRPWDGGSGTEYYGTPVNHDFHTQFFDYWAY